MCVEVYGVTKRPLTNKYAIVMEYYEKGNLQSNLVNICKKPWNECVDILYSLAKGLKTAQEYVLYWEWIEPKQFFNIKHLVDSGFSSVYKATWIDGPRDIKYNDDDDEKRTRVKNIVVVLKVPNVPDWSGNSNNITVEFLNEVSLRIDRNHVICDIKSVANRGHQRLPDCNEL